MQLVMILKSKSDSPIEKLHQGLGLSVLTLTYKAPALLDL